MKNKFPESKKNGMTLAEVSLGMMVMVIFFSLISLSTKFLKVSLKSSFALNEENSSWINNEHTIYRAMNRWSDILSQPSYTRENIEQLGCRYIPKNNNTIWDTPGIEDSNLPSNYKYCVLSSILGESNYDDLINGEKNAKPGIYFLYAIPNELTPSSKPIRKIICRPQPFC